jgi:hypothetical protein
MNNALTETAARVAFYENLELDAEALAMRQAFAARRGPAYLADTMNGAAARTAGDAGAYGRKADELREGSL